MKRQMLRLSLALLVVLTTALGAWVWTAEYDANPDPRARFEIEGVQVTRDRSNAWLEIHLRKADGGNHDFRKMVRLVTADGVEHEPADFTFSGSPETGFTDIWFKFWLEGADLEGKMDLLINGGKLRVKTSGDSPKLDSRGTAVFKSSDWKKSWLGF